jgi:hypothetical protein
MIYFLAIVLANIALVSSELTSYQPFDNHLYLINWNINEEKGLITFNITCKTEGWVGIGFSDKGRMLGSDLNICYMNTSNDILCVDGYAMVYSFKPDKELGGQDNITNVSGSFNNGILTVSFSKSLNSGDKYDKVIEKGKEMHVLFSYRANGNPVTESGEINKHSQKVEKDIVVWE